MDRKRFLERAALAVGGLVVGRHVPLPPAVEAGPMEVGLVRDSLLTTVNDYQLFASGGLCAPLTPIYNMPAFSVRPIHEAFPSFTAERAGLDYQRVRLHDEPSG